MNTRNLATGSRNISEDTATLLNQLRAVPDDYHQYSELLNSFIRILMENYLFQNVDAWVSEIVGKPCWGVAAGGSAGSAFTLDVGDKKNRNLSHLSEELRAGIGQFVGEFVLFVHSARWKLGSNQNNVVRILTDSDDDCSVDGPIVQGLNSLVGNTIARADFDRVSYDLNIYFSIGQMRLKIFGEVPHDHNGYSLFLPDRIISLDGVGNISYESRSV